MSNPTTATRIIEKKGEAYAKLLRTAFDQVCDPEDWKGPIDCRVPWEAASLFVEAIVFMTGVMPACNMVTTTDGYAYAHLTCCGYRMGPAGDH